MRRVLRIAAQRELAWSAQTGLTHLGCVGLEHILDERLPDGQQLGELARDLDRHDKRSRESSRVHALSAARMASTPPAGAAPGRQAGKPAQRGVGCCPLTRSVSSRLLLRGATMTLACSSTVKLAHVNSGSMYCLYSSMI